MLQGPGGSPAACVREIPARRREPVAEIHRLNISTSVPRACDTGSSVRERLRAATSAVHEALHGAAPFAKIAAGQLDRRGYAALLGALHTFHTSMAPLVSAACAELRLPAVDRGAARRRDDLRHDLRACAGTMRTDVPEVGPHGGACAVGGLYTVLGSTLGGRVIHGQLDYLFAGTEGRRFFAGSREDGALWRSFCIALELYGGEGHSAGHHTDAISAGASFAFAHFAACLEGQA